MKVELNTEEIYEYAEDRLKDSCKHKYNLYEKGHIKAIFYCEKCLDIQKVDINQRIKF